MRWWPQSSSATRGELRDELGDLLFQVVFLAQLASERGEYDFDDVAAGIADKLTQRHPHVFAGEGPAAHHAGKRSRQRSDGTRRHRRAGRCAAGTAGADACDQAGQACRHRGIRLARCRRARATKILEELAEVQQARAGAGDSTVEDEIGDLLLAVTSLARHLQR